MFWLQLWLRAMLEPMILPQLESVMMFMSILPPMSGCHPRTCTAIQGHSNVWAQAAAEGHVWVRCPTETRVCADVHGPFLPLGAMGELAPVAWTMERVSPTPHRPPQLPPSGRTGPSSVGTGDLAPTFVDRGRIAPGSLCCLCSRSAGLCQNWLQRSGSDPHLSGSCPSEGPDYQLSSKPTSKILSWPIPSSTPSMTYQSM